MSAEVPAQRRPRSLELMKDEREAAENMRREIGLNLNHAESEVTRLRAEYDIALGKLHALDKAIDAMEWVANV